MASASAATKSNNKSNNSNNSNTNKIKIISFNVASPDTMCFNMHINPEISQDNPPIPRETREPCYKNIEPLENTNKRASLIVGHLNSQNVNNDVDFMCFQEMFDELHQEIKQNLTNYSNYSTESTTDSKRDISIYYNNNKWEIDKIHINQNKKLLIEFELILDSKIKYLVCNIHNKGTNDEDQRKDFFRNIIDIITKSGNPSIIVGDFNYQVIQREFVGFQIGKKEGSDIDFSSYHRWAWDSPAFKDKGVKNFKLNDYILTYNINNKITIERIPEKFYKKISEKKINIPNHKGKGKGRALPIMNIETNSIEVPYKCVKNDKKEIVCSENFEEPKGFPSDHTMNIYEIYLNKPLNPAATMFFPGALPPNSSSNNKPTLPPPGSFGGYRKTKKTKKNKKTKKSTGKSIKKIRKKTKLPKKSKKSKKTKLPKNKNVD
jgi:hypothetical protein